MAYTMKVRVGVTKPPAVLMCPRLRGQKTEEIICITSNETGKKQKGLKDVCWNQAAKNEQSDSPIGSLSVQVSCLAGVVMSAVYLVCFEDKWTSDALIGHKVPFQVYAVPFFSLLLFCFCGSRMLPTPPYKQRGRRKKTTLKHHTSQFSSLERNKQQRMTTALYVSVHSGTVVALPIMAPTDHLGSVLLSTCSVPTCYH